MARTDADMCLHSKMPLVALLGRMHFGASIIVASTRVPCVVMTPASDNHSLMLSKIFLSNWLRSSRCLTLMIVVQVYRLTTKGGRTEALVSSRTKHLPWPRHLSYTIARLRVIRLDQSMICIHEINFSIRPRNRSLRVWRRFWLYSLSAKVS